MIDKSTVDKIFGAANIFDVVSDFISLRKKGVSYVGLCPFHNDKTPSLMVTPSKNIFKCFACGEGGGPVQFVMKHEKLSYYEALKYLAKKFGIAVTERELTDDEKQADKDRESMLIVSSRAQKHFTSRLFEHDEGRTVGMSYFIERGFREETVRKFMLGYSLNKRDDLYKTLTSEGYKEDYLLKTGLIKQREDGTMSDPFRGRVIFPILSVSGKVVAFGARILGKNDKVAKYLNSSESEIYHKSYELYGIFFAKQAIAKADKCFLVEGYTDVISMFQSGIENIVAPCGTSLTKEQVRLIHRFTANITLLNDGDNAGRKATNKDINLFLEEGFNVRIVSLPEGEDPDSFARKNNSFDLNLYIKEHETDFIKFKTAYMMRNASTDPLKKASLIKDIMESVSVIPDAIIRSVYIKECSQTLDVSEETLVKTVNELRARRPIRLFNAQKQVPEDNSENAVMPSDEEQSEHNKTAIEAEPSPLKRYEYMLLSYVIRFGEREIFTDPQPIKVVKYIDSELKEDSVEIATPLYRQILEECLEQCEDNDFNAERFFLAHTDQDVAKLAADTVSNRYRLSRFFQDPKALPDELHDTASEEERNLFVMRKRDEERKQLEQWVVHDVFTMKNAFVKMKIESINESIRRIVGDNDEDQITMLLKERIKYERLMSKLSKHVGYRIISGVKI
ncbi:MAG: DNA primase [Tannerella sp.]|jgi:DNA primase|nr:DNA primase [Tannerella sp.]